jgi:hypothetical protein
MSEIYVSTDIEADGPIPGVYSMLSLGSAAFDEDGELISTFSANLESLHEAVRHQKNMAWWKKNPEAWTACRENTMPPKTVMKDYVFWLKGFSGDLVFVGYPAALDFMFVYWYLMRFVGNSPFSHSALDIRSYAMSIIGESFKKASKRSMPKRWFKGCPKHSHKALDDAIEQGIIFCNMRAERKRKVLVEKIDHTTTL